MQILTDRVTTQFGAEQGTVARHFRIHCALSSVGSECNATNVEVGGSNPSGRAKIGFKNGNGPAM